MFTLIVSEKKNNNNKIGRFMCFKVNKLNSLNKHNQISTGKGLTKMRPVNLNYPGRPLYFYH